MKKSFIFPVVLVTCLAGCITPDTLQHLRLFPTRPPAVEARAYDWHDPFPDESAGPETYNRPRQFLDPRTEPRKNFDLRFYSQQHPWSPSARAIWSSPRWSRRWTVLPPHPPLSPSVQASRNQAGTASPAVIPSLR